MGNKMIVGTRCFLYAYKKSDFENQFDSKSSNMGTGYEKSPHFAGIEKIL